ncbi:hypothetical protein AGLY_002413 [Aphis glycines]|uniref:Uncharacterized protein n=1 Tax=Aphis glycines TaxID=307491 RepID=A0A6G0U3U6_APHGL|nr:hypothetical protein AGLY_002413 [Aphis glycines]
MYNIYKPSNATYFLTRYSLIISGAAALSSTGKSKTGSNSIAFTASVRLLNNVTTLSRISSFSFNCNMDNILNIEEQLCYLDSQVNHINRLQFTMPHMEYCNPNFLMLQEQLFEQILQDDKSTVEVGLNIGNTRTWFGVNVAKLLTVTSTFSNWLTESLCSSGCGDFLLNDLLELFLLNGELNFDSKA